MGHVESEGVTSTAGAADERPAPRPGAPGWLQVARESFDSIAGLLAVALVLVQALWRGLAVKDGYFTQDDYLHLEHAQGALDLQGIGALHSGEFSPVANALTWLTVQVGGTGWGVVTVAVLILQAAAALLLWVVLSQLLPGRWVRLPVLAAAVFTPLTLASTLTWSLAAMYWPAAICLLVAASALLAQQQEAWRPGGRLAVVAVAVALLCTDRAVLVPLVLFALLAAAAEPADLRVRARWAVVIKQSWLTWLLMAVLVAARLTHAAVTGRSSFGWVKDANSAVDVVIEYLRQVLSGLVGGPWSGAVVDSALHPTNRLVFGFSVLLAAAVSVLFVRCVRRPAVATALVGLLFCVVASVAVVWFTATDVAAFGVGARHHADAVLVFVLLGAAALRQVTLPASTPRVVTSVPVVVAGVATVALAVSSFFTARVLVPSLQNADDRSFVENLQRGLDANPQTVLLDGPVPDGVLHPWFGDRATVSTIAGLLPQQPTFAVPSEVLRMVDLQGHLREVGLVETVPAAAQAEGCEHSITTEPTSVPLVGGTPDKPQILSFGYLVGSATFAEVEAGSQRVRVPFHSGLKTVQVPLEGGFDHFTMRLDGRSSGDAVACLAQVVVGTPVQGSYGGAR